MRLGDSSFQIDSNQRFEELYRVDIDNVAEEVNENDYSSRHVYFNEKNESVQFLDKGKCDANTMLGKFSPKNNEFLLETHQYTDLEIF